MEMAVQAEITRRIVAGIAQQRAEQAREARVRFYLAIPESLYKRYTSLLWNGDLLPREINRRLVDALDRELGFFERLAATEQPAVPSAQRVEPGEY